MKIIPAIDLREGRVVRLLRGDYDDVTLYSTDPGDIAKRWFSQGAGAMHVVDLDGAFAGEPRNMDAVSMIVKAANVPVQLGGGLRNIEDIGWAFNVGVAKVILGTKVVTDIAFISSAIKKYGNKIIVSIDAKKGFVMMKGWTESSSINAIDMARRMEHLGVSEIIYTDVTVDGTLAGPNITRLDSFLGNVKMPVIIAGGISCIHDIKNLCALNKKNLSGIIIGKALYEGTINLKEAITTCSRRE